MHLARQLKGIFQRTGNLFPASLQLTFWSSKIILAQAAITKYCGFSGLNNRLFLTVLETGSLRSRSWLHGFSVRAVFLAFRPLPFVQREKELWLLPLLQFSSVAQSWPTLFDPMDCMHTRLPCPYEEANPTMGRASRSWPHVNLTPS